MIGIDVRFEGLEQALEGLARMAPRTNRTLMRRALRAGGRVIELRAKEICPVGETGKLKASIGVHEVTDEHAVIGPTAHYGGYVELGTRRMAARPYLRPAVEHHRQEIIDAMVDAIASGIRG